MSVENRLLNTPTKIHELVNQQIVVGDSTYNFNDYIEKEMISDFPTYSHRIRNGVFEGSKIVDKFLETLTNEFNNLENNYQNLSNEKREEVTQHIEQIKRQFDEYKTTKSTELDNFVREKGNSIEQYLQEKNIEWTTLKNSIDEKLSDSESRVNRINEVLNETLATENKAGLITEARVRELAPMPTPATDTVRGTITLNDINLRLNQFGIGRNDTTNLNLDSKLKSGIYTTTHSSKINIRTTTVINVQYDDDWGVQLGLTEEDEPKAYLRAKRDGRWTAWELVAEKRATTNEIMNSITTNASLSKPMKSEDIIKFVKGITGAKTIKQFTAGVFYSSGDIVMDNSFNFYEVTSYVYGANIINSSQYRQLNILR